MSTATDLYLVRHGETLANQDHRFCGVTDVALTDAGQRQALAVAAWSKPLRLQAVYASPLRRAQDTALAIAQATGLTVRTRRGIIERHYGDWENLRWPDIAAGWPELAEPFREDPAAHAPPRGEACAHVLTRFRRALAALARAHAGQALAVVSHQSALRIYLASLLGVPLRDHYKDATLTMGNTAVSLVCIDRGQARAIWVGRTAHLGPC